MRQEFERRRQRAVAMTIEIHKPELEALIPSRLDSGQSAEDALSNPHFRCCRGESCSRQGSTLRSKKESGAIVPRFAIQGFGHEF
jgi:hypothetical protein